MLYAQVHGRLPSRISPTIVNTASITIVVTKRSWVLVEISRQCSKVLVESTFDTFEQKTATKISTIFGTVSTTSYKQCFSAIAMKAIFILQEK